jgi:hypothetical protein
MRATSFSRAAAYAPVLATSYCSLMSATMSATVAAGISVIVSSFRA